MADNTSLNVATTDASGQKIYVSGASPTDVSAAINSQHLTPQMPINLPSSPPPTNYGAAVTGGNALINANNGSLSNGAASDTITPTSDISQTLKSLGLDQPPPSSEGQYASDYANSGIDTKQGQVNTDLQAEKDATGRLKGLQAQLDAVTAKGQAMNLQNQGREAPSFAISGQEAENNRQIAIEALPLQAQILSAQADVLNAHGDTVQAQSVLQQAQDHVDTMFKLHQQDAQAQYDYRKEQLKAVYDTYTAAQKTKADQLQKERDQAFSTKLAVMNDVHSQANALLKTDPTISSKLMGLDPNNPSYQQNAAALIAQVKATPTAEEESQGAISTISAQLIKARDSAEKPDGYTNPNLYARLRAASSLSPTDFDNRFAYLVNPLSYGKLGLTATNASTGQANYTAADQQGLVGAGVPSTELPQLQSFIGQYGVQAFFKNNPTLTGPQKDAINKVYGTSF